MVTMGESLNMKPKGQMTGALGDEGITGELFFALQNSKIEQNQYLFALIGVLTDLRWKGTIKDLVSSLPSKGEGELDLPGMRNVLSRLGYTTEVYPAERVKVLTASALHIAKDGEATIIDPEDTIPRHGQIMFYEQESHTAGRPPQTSWLHWTISGLWPQILTAIIASLFINLCALALPFYTRYVYDRAIPAHSENALIYLGGGVLLVVLFNTVFRNVRSKMLTYAGSRIAYLAGTESISKLFSLPLSVLLRSNADSHILRFRDLERLREFVTGSFATTLLDAPFIAIFLIAIGYLGGYLVVVPICALIFYGLLIPVLSMAEDRAMRISAKLNADRTSMQHDVVNNIRDIIGVGMEYQWLQRYSQTMTKSARANREYTIISTLLRIIARTISAVTALATLGFGVKLVFDNSITAGALIASMMIIWRITAPAQTFATTFSRYYQLRHSADQIDRLMDLSGENLEHSLVSPLKGLPKTIAVNRVVYRHSPDREPALAGISFNAEEGQIIGITGPNGAGKSTLLLAITGLLQPQGGSIMIGGRDIRQFQPEDLRSWLGYMSSDERPFRGTLRSNLLVGKPDATDWDMQLALEKAGVPNLVNELPEGLDTLMYTERGLRVGHDTQQAIAIAKILLKDSPILIFDDPIFHSEEQESNFISTLNDYRGKRTMLIASHNKALLEQCDRVLLLDHGSAVSFGSIPKPENNTSAQ